MPGKKKSQNFKGVHAAGDEVETATSYPTKKGACLSKPLLGLNSLKHLFRFVDLNVTGLYRIKRNIIKDPAIRQDIRIIVK